MIYKLSDAIRDIVSKLPEPEVNTPDVLKPSGVSDASDGSVKIQPRYKGDPETHKKFRKSPKIKAPRRNPSTSNKTDQSDYMKNYMKNYRGEGKDYQKLPEAVKKRNRERAQERKKERSP